MDGWIADLYKQTNMERYEDIHLLTLSEECAVLEERLYRILPQLSERDRAVLQDYIDKRNDLEVEMVKTALRWAKHHYG